MISPSGSPALRRSMLALFFLSGATSLVYQVVWLRQLVLVFGSTLHATSTILAVFMGGLAAGAYGGGRLTGRRGGRPLAAYGALEIAIGLFALAVPVMLRLAEGAFEAAWTAGASSRPVLLGLVKFGAIALLLLPPTTLMGATLPVLSRRIADDPDRLGGQVGLLYAVNTFGAVAGTFLAGFILLPTWGVRWTTIVCAAANVALGATAIGLSRREPVRSPVADRAVGPAKGNPRNLLVLLVITASGFCAMVLEVAWTRGLALVFGSSVYAFALMLLAFLIGLAAGSAAVSALLRSRRPPAPGQVLAVCLAAAGAGAFATTYVLQELPGWFATIFFATVLPPTVLFAVQLGLGLLLMAPTTFALGGVFPAVVQIVARGIDHVPAVVGRAYAANTAGTIAGAASAGFVLVPALGLVDTLAATAAAQLALAAIAVAILAELAGLRRILAACGLAALAVLAPLARPDWDFLTMNAGVYFNLIDAPPGSTWDSYLAQRRETTRVVLGREGLNASVLVADHEPSSSRYLAVNGKIEASSRADMETQIMAGHLPLLIHPDPRDVLVVGLASGISVGAVASHRVATIRVLEIEEAMIEAARLFSTWNGSVLDDPRVTVSINDARNELRYDRRSYDVIVSQPSNPWMTVASNLFTEDFFVMAKRKLRRGGVFCQWVQLYCLHPDDVRSVIAAFRSAFPHVVIFGTLRDVDLLLLGAEEPIRIDAEAVALRMRDLPVRMSLARAGVASPEDLLALFRTGERGADALADGASPNTDDNGRIEFAAPKALYADTIDANQALLLAAQGDPIDLLDPRPASADDADRLRIAIARRSLERGESSWGIRLAESALSGSHRTEAEALVKALKRH